MITRLILPFVWVCITSEALLIKKDIIFNLDNRIKICEDYAAWNKFHENWIRKSEIALTSHNELSCMSTDVIFIPKGVLQAEIFVEFTSLEDIFTISLYESFAETYSLVKRSHITMIHNGAKKIEIVVTKSFYGMISLIGKTSEASKITLRSIYFSFNLPDNGKNHNTEAHNTKKNPNIKINTGELNDEHIKSLPNVKTRTDEQKFVNSPLSISSEENINESLATTILFPSVSQATESTAVTIPFPSVSQSTTVTIPFPSVSQTTVTVPFPSVSQTTTESTTVTIPFPSVSQTTESTTVTIPFPSVSQTTESTTVTIPFPSVSQTTTESTTVTIPFPSVSQTTTESTTVTIPFPSVSQTTVTVPFPSVSETTTEATTIPLPETESPNGPNNETEGLSIFLITIISLSAIVFVIIISFIVAFLFCTTKNVTHTFTEKP